MDIQESVNNLSNNGNTEKQEGLLRLFQSSIFDMDLAIQYLSKYTEYGIQAFLVNKFFSYPHSSVDFYLPQLVCLFVANPHLSDIFKSYFIYRCNESVEYTMLLEFLIDSYVNYYSYINESRQSSLSLDTGSLSNVDHVMKFKSLIINGNLSFNHPICIQMVSKNDSNEDIYKQYKNHKRSTSDLSGMNRVNSVNKSLQLHFYNNDLFDGTNVHENNGYGDNCGSGVRGGDDDTDSLELEDNYIDKYRSKIRQQDSQSINSLLDLLSGHAFDNVCNMCNQNSSNSASTGNKGLSNFRPVSTLSLPGKCKLFASTHSIINCNNTEEIQKECLSPKLTMRGNLKNQCHCCHCSSYFIDPQRSFIKFLVSISMKLSRYPSKYQKTNHLRAELAHLNLNLPARVWIPIYEEGHYVIRIPPNAAVCLNSKNRAPYLIYVEVISTPNRFFDELIQKKQVSMSTEKVNSSFSSLQDVDCSNFVHLKEILDTDESGEELNVSDETYIAAGDIRRRLKENISAQSQQDNVKVNDDPSASVLFEPWHKKMERIKDSSPYGKVENWHLLSVIVKHGDDLRQEQLAYQVLKMLQKVWNLERTPLWVRPLNIVVISSDSGMIEPILNAVSIHQIKRLNSGKSLCNYFKSQFGPPNSESFLTAQKNFVESCAAYSLICYLLQVKDRHNGNILLDNEGHMIHIDYGFILSASPGRNLGFEFSPFKLTYEEVEVMGGIKSDMFEYFKILILQGLFAARKHMDKILITIEILNSASFKLPCFNKDFETIYKSFQDRFHLNKTDAQLQILVDKMVENSLDSLTTRLYDSYQYYTNGIQ